MRKRTCNMLLRLTKEEMDNLAQKAKKAGLSREGYCRTILNGSSVKEAPSADVPKLIWEVRRVGSNIDRILKTANAKGLPDVPQLRKALEDNRAVEKLIVEVYTQPDA